MTGQSWAALAALGLVAGAACNGIFGIRALPGDDGGGPDSDAGDANASSDVEGAEGGAGGPEASDGGRDDGAADAVAIFDASNGGEAPDDGPVGDDRRKDASIEAGAPDVSEEDTTGDGDAVAGDAAPSPAAIAPSHLRLWLRADTGVTCISGRVSRWADQSANHDDAVLGQTPPQLGPQCGVAGYDAGASPHAVGGVELPYFSAPTNGNVVDETLDVDLGFLKGSDFTIFAVERRWADGNASTRGGFFLGTTVQTAVNSGILTSLMFGYASYDPVQQPMPRVVLDEGNDLIESTFTYAVPATPPAVLSQETATLDQTRGREIWRNGTPVAVDTIIAPLVVASGGGVGRAFFQTGSEDVRFRGDIAEIVVYDAALGDTDRLAVESYLRRWGY